MLNRVPKSQFCGAQKHAAEAVKVVENLGFGIWVLDLARPEGFERDQQKRYLTERCFSHCRLKTRGDFSKVRVLTV